MANLEGQQLGQYEIIEQIAKGGMATVYRARQRSLGRDVAIKVLPRHFTHEETFLERFYREVEIIASLQHPHILPVYDFGQHDELPYIAMAYLSGGTLEDRINAGNMPLAEVRRIIKQIADALDFAHSKNIIHRDFKPANVLLDEQGNTYLADFGLAKITQVASNLTGTSILGTPAYMAPEQTDSDEPTGSVDIYAFMVTIYQMLTGKLPYNAPTASGILMAHVMQPVPDIRPLRPDLPDTVQTVVEHGMAKDPAMRYQNAGVMIKDLSLALEGKSTSELASIEPEIVTALLMTNMLGRVIFVDNQCLRILRMHQHEARTIIGKAMHEVLGCDAAFSNQLIAEVGKAGKISGQKGTVRDAKGLERQVVFSAVATYDEDNKFVGADITLEVVPTAIDAEIAEGFSSVQKPADSREENYLEAYFKAQISSLYQTLKDWAGTRIAHNLEDILNETGQRNVWPVTMTSGHITIELKRSDIDIYRALLARAITYTASIVGDKPVVKALQTVNKNTDPSILHFVENWGLEKLHEELLKK